MVADAALPPLYATWMEHLLGGVIPAEAEADCFNCGMIARSFVDRVQGLSCYHPETRCCTYHPALPGFLAGRILSDESPPGKIARKELEKRIHSGVGIIPTAIEASPLFRLAYGKNPRGLFGKTRSLRCPHYLDGECGACGIWANRPGICATWFCRHSRGRRSIRFWKALKDLFASIERELSLWCVAQLAPDARTVDALLRYLEEPAYIPEADDIDGCLRPARYLELWGGWRGREREFYLESARIVESLSWDEAVRTCGPRVTLLAGLASEAYRALSDPPPVPSRLRAGEIRLLHYGAESCFILACEEVLEFPRKLMEVFSFFDGRPLDEARHEILKEKNLRINDSLIRQLVDFELLLPAEDLFG